MQSWKQCAIPVISSHWLCGNSYTWAYKCTVNRIYVYICIYVYIHIYIYIYIYRVIISEYTFFDKYVSTEFFFSLLYICIYIYTYTYISKVNLSVSGIWMHNYWIPFRRSNRLSYQAMIQLALRADFLQLLLFHLFVQCSHLISGTVFVSRHICFKQNLA